MDKLEYYLRTGTRARSKEFQQIEQFANEHDVPIMEPISMNLLTQLIRIKKPTTILEIGTAIGYSALRMADVNPEANITTIEKSEKMYHQAKENVYAMKRDEQITVRHGDALEVIASLMEECFHYDLIFIDAAKAQYRRYFEAVQPLTKEDTVIICDNILFKGYVADDTKADNQRMVTLANKIRSFNSWILQHPDYHTSIIPIGDGVSISVKTQ